MDGLYKAIDGSALSYSKWGGEQPDDRGPNNCVRAIPMDYVWDDTNCAMVIVTRPTDGRQEALRVFTFIAAPLNL